MRQRYFVTKRNGKPVVYDRELDLVVAQCNYREQATLVAIALNYHENITKAMVSEAPRVYKEVSL